MAGEAFPDCNAPASVADKRPGIDGPTSGIDNRHDMGDEVSSLFSQKRFGPELFWRVSTGDCRAALLPRWLPKPSAPLDGR